MSCLHARSIAAVNSWGSRHASWLGRLACLGTAEDETGAARVIAEGGAFDDHFQPGAFVSSSRRERRRADEGAEESLGDGKRRSVIENPGMFRLVYCIGEIPRCDILE